MRCDECDRATRVIDSRPQLDGCVMRIRQCRECGYRFSTTEVPDHRNKARIKHRGGE